MNALSVLISGFICLKALGLEPSTYYKRKSAESMHKAIPIGIILIMLLGIPLSFSFYDAPLDDNVQSEAKQYFGDNLVDIRRNSGDFTVIVYGNHSSSDFESKFEVRDVKVIMLERRLAK